MGETDTHFQYFLQGNRGASYRVYSLILLIHSHLQLKKAKKQKDDLGSQFLPSFLPLMLFGDFLWLPFYRAIVNYFLFIIEQQQKAIFFFFSQLKKNFFLAWQLTSWWKIEVKKSKSPNWLCYDLAGLMYYTANVLPQFIFSLTLVPTVGTCAYPMRTK